MDCAAAVVGEVPMAVLCLVVYRNFEQPLESILTAVILGTPQLPSSTKEQAGNPPDPPFNTTGGECSMLRGITCLKSIF